jgi:hypothetical protein
MAVVSAVGKLKTGSISAVVTRKDGRRIDLGIVSYTSRNPLKHYPMQVWIKLKRWWMGV